jgi:hypothetical protein
MVYQSDDERVVSLVFFSLNGHPDEWYHTNWLDVRPDATVDRVLIRPEKFTHVE